MNHKKIALFAFLILLFAAGFALWQMRPRPTTVRLDMKGTEGIKVADTITVDGIQREFSALLPTNITVKARNFQYTIMMQEPRGEMSARITAGAGLYCSASTANDFSGVRGHFSHSWRGKSASATTAQKTP